VISPEANSAGQGTVLRVIPLDNCSSGSGLARSGDKLVVQCGGDIRVIQEGTGQQLALFTMAVVRMRSGSIPPMATSIRDYRTAGDVHCGHCMLDMRHLQYLGIEPVAAGLGTHSVAAGGRNNRVFLAMGECSIAAHNAGDGGIGTFHHDDRDPGGSDDQSWRGTVQGGRRLAYTAPAPAWP